MAIPAALILSTILAAVGVAADYSRIASLRSSLSNALDSALLATAIQLQNEDMTDEEAAIYLSDFMNSNLSTMEITYKVKVASINIDWDTQEVSADVVADLPMTITKVMGKDVVPVSVGGSTVFGVDETEVAMTFDITGSMSGSKLASLKTAAKVGINELLSVNTKSRDFVRISVIPYADAVNSGTIFQGTLEKNQKLPDGRKTERPGKFLYTDDGPGKGPPLRDSRLGYCPSAVI